MDALDRRHLRRGADGEHDVIGLELLRPVLVPQPASRTFYHDTLGLAILAEDEERIVLRCGGGTQLGLSRSTIGTADTQTQMARRVPDLRAALADLRARGVRIEEYEARAPVTVDGIADMGYSWAASFIDPSRNVLEFVQPKV